MGCSIAELRNKEVICKLNGTRIGNVDDVELDINNGRLVSIIGEDTILVNCECPVPKGRA